MPSAQPSAQVPQTLYYVSLQLSLSLSLTRSLFSPPPPPLFLILLSLTPAHTHRHIHTLSYTYLMIIYSTAFKLDLVDRIRGTYLDYRKSTITWNHGDGEEVGGSSVATVKVNIVIIVVMIIDSFGCIYMYSTDHKQLNPRACATRTGGASICEMLARTRERKYKAAS